MPVWIWILIALSVGACAGLILGGALASGKLEDEKRRVRALQHRVELYRREAEDELSL